MAIRDKMRRNSESLLQPGEQVQAVFGAQTASNYLMMLGVLPFLLVNQYRVVVVTDRRILVARSGRLTTTPVRDVLRELPRKTKIGPTSGIWWMSSSLGEPLRVHKRFHKDVDAADAAIGWS